MGVGCALECVDSRTVFISPTSEEMARKEEERRRREEAEAEALQEAARCGKKAEI